MLEELLGKVEETERERQLKAEAQRAEADRAREIRERDRLMRADERVKAGSESQTDSSEKKAAMAVGPDKPTR